MTPAERTRLLLLAASAGTEATLRRALFDWAMEGDEANTAANPEKLAAEADAKAENCTEAIEKSHNLCDKSGAREAVATPPGHLTTRSRRAEANGYSKHSTAIRGRL